MLVPVKRATTDRLHAMPHQETALIKVKDLDQIPLYMEMRLGKTLVLIRWALRRLKDMIRIIRILVIGPLSVLPGWRTELRREGQGSLIIRGTPSQRILQASGVGWRLINYEALRASARFSKDGKRLLDPGLLSMDWDLVVCDESTRIRNADTKITKLLCEGTTAKYRAVLSGMPAPESALDYFPQIHFLHGHFMGVGGSIREGYYTFRKKNFRELRDGWTWKIKAKSAKEIRAKINELGVVMTRAQAKVGSKKFYEQRVVPMNAEQARIQKELMAEYSAICADGKRASTEWSLARSAWLARIAGGFDPRGNLINDAKVTEVVDLLTGELKNEPVLVWFNFNEEKRHVVKALMAAGVSVADIDGSVDLESRAKYCEMLNDGKIQALCFQVRTGLFGLDLAKATTSIYYSNAYDGELRYQSEDRMIKVTKTEPCLYLDLITEGSADEHVVQLLRDKRIKSRYFMAKVVEQLSLRRVA